MCSKLNASKKAGSRAFLNVLIAALAAGSSAYAARGDEAARQATSILQLKVKAPNAHKIRDPSLKPTADEPGAPSVRKISESVGAAPLIAKDGITAVAGRVVSTTGAALPNVSVQDETQRTTTDNEGRYLLSNVPPGTSVLTIDAHHAGPESKIDYGYYEVQVATVAGQTTVLPYTNWLTQIDHRHEVTIPSPTTKEVVITNPDLPGLEFRLPKGTIVTGADHKPVRKIGITRIPVDRTPFPLPANVKVPIYFTVQPGGAVLSGVHGKWVGAQVWYPNFNHQLPKARATFFRYDPYHFDWTVYGTGTVPKNRKHYVPDKGTRIYTLSSAMIDGGFTPPPYAPPVPPHCPIEVSCCGAGATPPPASPGGQGAPPDGPPNPKPPQPPGANPPSCGGSGGDPVDLASGLWADTATDMSLADIMPLAFSRTYMSGDANARSFGVGMTLNYETYLWSAQQYQQVDLIMPEGSRVHYVCTANCPDNNYATVVFTAQTNPGVYYNSTIVWNGSGWTLTRLDGTIYVFPEYAPLSYIQDRLGNRINFLRSGGPTSPITTISSPNGRSITLNYTNGVITQATDNLGRSFAYAYDSDKRLRTVTDPDNGITTYNWDTTNNWITSVQRARQYSSGPQQLTNLYDANGRVKTQTLADTSTWGFQYTLDGNGNVIETDVTDPNTNVHKVTFNTGGYWLTQKFGFGSPQEQDYVEVLGGSTPPPACTANTPANSPTNYQIAVTDQLSRLTCRTYDSGGNVLMTTQLAGTSGAVTTSFAYGPFEQLTQITDPLGHTVQIGRDSQGRSTSLTDGTNNVWPVSANSDGTIASITDPLGNKTAFTYDHGDLVSITDPLNRTSTRFSDAVGRTIHFVDQMNDSWQWTHDPLWGVSQSIDANGNTATKNYNADGGVASFVDPRSSPGSPIQTQFAYDSLDRLQTRTDPLSHTSTINGYDGNGNVHVATDRKGQAVTYGYDPLNRISTASYVDGHSVAYSWDNGNRLTKIKDTVGGVSNTITRNYDLLDRLKQEKVVQGSQTSTVDYTYDDANRRATMTVSGQTQIVYKFDKANHLTKITQGSAVVAIGIDPAGRRSSISYPNGIVSTPTYDAASEIKEISYDNGPTNVGTLTYTYDGAGRVATRGGTLFTSVLPNTVLTAAYDADNRLKLWGGTGISLGYDSNGNLTSSGGNSYTWDSRNRLTAITGVANFAYDGMDRRASVTTGSTTITTVYDGFNQVQELSGSSVRANLLTGQALDERFTRTEGSSTQTYLTDLIGSTVSLADSTGTITTSYIYDPYGSSTVSGAASDNPYQFTGSSNDGTGLYYYRDRFYNPSWGRFISEDKIGLEGGPNLYAYAVDRPTSVRDPTGKQGWEEVLGAYLGLIAMDALLIETEREYMNPPPPLPPAPPPPPPPGTCNVYYPGGYPGPAGASNYTPVPPGSQTGTPEPPEWPEDATLPPDFNFYNYDPANDVGEEY